MFRARGCTAEEAADLAQEAAVRAFMHIRRWGVTGAGLDPLLNRIARNLLIDRYRRTTPHIVPLDDAGELHDPDQDPTEEVVRRQRRSAVQSAIRALPVRHRDAITYSLNGLSPEEVGRQMGIGRNAADALLHRARRSLKERLQTVGEGMFGVALGFRVRVDRLFRRNGIDARLGDVSIGALSQAGLSLATAAVFAVLSTGGAGASATPSIGHTFRPSAGISLPATSGGAGSEMPVTNSVSDGSSAGSGSSGSGAKSYRLGPASTSYAPDRVDNRVLIPDPLEPDGAPLVDINHSLYQKTVDDNRGPVCLVAPSVCDLLGGLRA